MSCGCKKPENIKKGKYKNIQLYQCKNCKKKFRETYSIERMNEAKRKQVVSLHCKGMGTRSIAKEMGISPVLRSLQVAAPHTVIRSLAKQDSDVFVVPVSDRFTQAKG